MHPFDNLDVHVGGVTGHNSATNEDPQGGQGIS